METRHPVTVESRDRAPYGPLIMKDYVGNEILVGSFVIYATPRYSELEFGKVVKINPKTVRVQPHDRETCLPKPHSYKKDKEAGCVTRDPKQCVVAVKK